MPSEVEIAVARNRKYIKLSWETKDGYSKEVTIPITEYTEFKMLKH